MFGVIKTRMEECPTLENISFVNYNLYPVEVSWETACDVYSDCDFSNAQKGVNRFTLPPLSVIMLK